MVGGFLASHPQLIPKAVNLHIDLLVYGFTAFTIFGGMSHLLPRIVWNWKFARAQRSVAINELVDEASFPRFMEISLAAFLIFMSIDLLFDPLRRLSPIPYLFILGYFVKITFFHLFKKIKEVKDGEGSTLRRGRR